MDTLSEQINDLRNKGYDTEFKIEGNQLKTSDGKESFSPKQLKVNEFYRFEGDSDPGDMSVLYAIETDNGKKGVIIDAFGTYSDAEESGFMEKIRELHKGNVY